MKIFNIEFLSPVFFILIVLVFIFIILFQKKQKKATNFLFFDDLKLIFHKNNFYYYLKLLFISLIIICFSLLLANPNIINKTETISKNGIDIVLILDISTSMNTNDLNPTRIEAAKQIINDFVGVQETNRVGLVLFAGTPFVSIPLTFDYEILKETINSTSTDNINQNYHELSGTAIGDAILIGETLFDKKNENREKAIILLTDGEATHGIAPDIAAIDARDNGIKIYTVGIGSEKGGEVIYNNGGFYQTQKIAPLNAETLIEIAKITSGEFFRATDNYSLETIFTYLEKLEKNDIEIEIKKSFSTDYKKFTYLLLGLLFSYILLIFYKKEI